MIAFAGLGDFEIFIIDAFSFFLDERRDETILDGLGEHDETTGAAVAVAERMDLFEGGVSVGEAFNRILARRVHIANEDRNSVRDRGVVREWDWATHDANAEKSVATGTFD